MSAYETTISNPKKQLEFYKDLSEQLQQENRELKTLLKGTTHCYDEEEHKQLREENQKQKEIINVLDFIKARAQQGATQETINKLAINFVNKYIKEVE